VRYDAIQYYPVSGLYFPTDFLLAPATLPISSDVGTFFPSWTGYADPASRYGPDFAQETGNSLWFAVGVLGNGTKISLSQLTFTMVSTDVGHTLDLSIPTSPGSYGSGFIGVDYGPDGVRGTSDDVIIDSGPSTQQVDELAAVGYGNAWSIKGLSSGQTPQGALDSLGDSFGPTPFDVTGTYVLTPDSGDAVMASATISFVPDPATLSLLALGALAMLRRRKQLPAVR